jgi:ribosomal protein L15
LGSRDIQALQLKKRKKNELNLDDIQKVYGGKDKIELEGYKILGKGDGFKAEIHAKSASKSAKEKMEKAGGKLVLEDNQIPTKEEVKTVLKK